MRCHAKYSRSAVETEPVLHSFIHKHAGGTFKRLPTHRVVKGVDSGTQLPGFENLALLLAARDLGRIASLCLSFLISKLGN